MKQLSSLMDYRPGIKVVDATLRDGGLVNDFYFSDDFVKALYNSNIKAGVDYMEFGYKASKDMFDVNAFGKWKFCDDDAIRDIVGDNKTDLKIAVMADVGRCDYKTDIIEKKDSPIDLIRVACYVHQIPGAVDMIENAHSKGYETSCNIMAVSTFSEDAARTALDIIGRSPVDIVYIVDSYGALYPEEIARLADLYCEFGAKYNKKIGIHAHDNQKLAFANTIEAVGDGVDFLDATYSGMGRGAGNCSMELLLGFLRNPKFNVFHTYKFVDTYINPIKESGNVWGYDLQYQMTGMLNQHPRTAIEFTHKNRKDYSEFYKELIMTD